VKDPGTTGATIVDGNILRTASAGSVTVTATVAGGKAAAEDYTQDFTIALYEALAGTKWYWGENVLTFLDDGSHAVINTLGWTTSTPGYDYTYDAVARSGYITGDINRRGGGEIYINDLGPFTITMDSSFALVTLRFSNYRESGTAITFARSYSPIDHDLIGVIWYGPNFLIECLDGANAILYALDGYYATTTKLIYNYDPDTKKGRMEHIAPSPLAGHPGDFEIIPNSPFNGSNTGGWYSPGYLDDWDWRGGPKSFIAAFHLAFDNWKNYGHGWDMVKLDENGIETAEP
jgi:hypothetical protein